MFLADSGIYEQGTPAEIFDAPKREKTVAFIHKIKYFTYEITRRDFDLMQLQGGIQNFGEKCGLDQKHTYRLQVCCEEVIYELLDHCYPNRGDVDLKLSVSHAESDGATQIAITCGGAAYNPFEQDEDGLGVAISSSTPVYPMAMPAQTGILTNPLRNLSAWRTSACTGKRPNIPRIAGETEGGVDIDMPA